MFFFVLFVYSRLDEPAASSGWFPSTFVSEREEKREPGLIFLQNYFQPKKNRNRFNSFFKKSTLFIVFFPKKNQKNLSRGHCLRHARLQGRERERDLFSARSAHLRAAARSAKRLVVWICGGSGRTDQRLFSVDFCTDSLFSLWIWQWQRPLPRPLQ